MYIDDEFIRKATKGGKWAAWAITALHVLGYIGALLAVLLGMTANPIIALVLAGLVLGSIPSFVVSLLLAIGITVYARRG